MSFEVVNYYDHLKKQDNSNRNYPNESLLNIPLPFRMLICGPSASGKTSLLMNIIKGVGIWDRVILLAKDIEEPLYQHLIDVYRAMEKKEKLSSAILLAITSIKELPPIDSFKRNENTLLICDDLICDKKQDLDTLAAFWIRGRKLGVSSCFLSQAYFEIPKLIRQNSNYILIKKVSTPKDLKGMLQQYSLGGITIDELKQMYDHAMHLDGSEKNGHHTKFFMIDTITSKKSLRFRAGFKPILAD